MDIAIVGGSSALVLLHIVFGWKACTTPLRLSGQRRYSWTVLSILLGPVGYYSFLGFLPSELLSDE